MIKTTSESLDIVKRISDNMEGHTFHHHYHILYDIGEKYEDRHINYVEIGCFAGASACLMLQRPNTNVISIDLGHPISQDLAKRNVEKFNVLGNSFVYLQGDSQTREMVGNLASLISDIDILFIDGDHSYSGVINDFSFYRSMVKPGGYIVFDDYNDSEFSPEVKPAVDDITKQISDEFEIIGVIPNLHNARPLEIKDGNEFVIRKL
jgi:predicted O-methyltransferase YrrM